MNKDLEKIFAFREAGVVRRAHTIPYIGEYNVAMHCYNALSMLLVLNPQASSSLIKAVLWHDTPERWTGDVPSPAKWQSETLKECLKDLEKKILERLEINEFFDNLTEEETQWLHGVDLLELYFWAEDQIHMGNQIAYDMKGRVLEAFSAREVPQDVIWVLESYKWERLPELDEFMEGI